MFLALVPVAGRTARRLLGRLGGDDAAAWAIRLPLVTLVVAATLSLARPR